MIKVQYVQVFQDSLGCRYLSWMALALPVVFETEKLVMLYLQQQQMLVGLNTALGKNARGSTNLECCCSSWADLVGKSWNSLVFESLIFLLLSFLFYIWCIDLSKPGESSPSFVSDSQPYLPSPLSSLQSSRELQGRLTPALVTPSPSPSCSQSDSPSLSRCRMETDATGREDLWPVTTVWLLF